MLNKAEKIDNIITYDRNITEMSRGRSTKADTNSNTNANSNMNNETGILKEEILAEIKELIYDNKQAQKKERQITWVNYVSIIGGIITVVMLVLQINNGIITPINNHSKDIEYIIKSIESIDDLSDDIDELSKFVYTNFGGGNSASNVSKDAPAKSVEFLDEYKPDYELVNNEPSLKNEFQKFVYIANGTEDKIKYNTEDLYYTKIITGYRDGEDEIYFLGQYNENNHWYGECILNIYKDHNLSCIFEAVYNDGELFSYRRISNEGDGTWEVADRVNKGEYKTGETWVYTNTIDYKQEISLNKYKESQILTFDDFINSTREKLLSYYNGGTSNGYYNDDSGNAYLIKYFEDGTIDGQGDKYVIRTLYQGKFVNGDLVDDTYSAWYITRETNTTYMYYEGSFSGGSPDDKKKVTFENYLNKNRIDEILDEKGFSEYKDKFFVEY